MKTSKARMIKTMISLKPGFFFMCDSFAQRVPLGYPAAGEVRSHTLAPLASVPQPQEMSWAGRIW